jgi:hypothetical protein
VLRPAQIDKLKLLVRKASSTPATSVSARRSRSRRSRRFGAKLRPCLRRGASALAAGRGSLPGDARRFISRRCDFRRRDRRRAPGRYAKTADVSVSSQRRARPAARSGGRASPWPATGAPSRPLVEPARTYRYPARISETLREPGGGDYRSLHAILPGSAGPPMRPLPPPQAAWARNSPSSGCDCPRDGRFAIGDRTRGCAA